MAIVEIGKVVAEHVELFHGGESMAVSSLVCGLNPERDFYCSRDKALAERAANDHFPGAIFSIIIPSAAFVEALARGYFEERPYLGCLAPCATTEVVVRKGDGIRYTNRFLPAIF